MKDHLNSRGLMLKVNPINTGDVRIWDEFLKKERVTETTTPQIEYANVAS